VIETVRGGGIFQPAIDEAIKKLQDGEWVGCGVEKTAC
jgi:monolysocardiolipin acyltransferase